MKLMLPCIPVPCPLLPAKAIFITPFPASPGTAAHQLISFVSTLSNNKCLRIAAKWFNQHYFPFAEDG
jgi:hypothetical protein